MDIIFDILQIAAIVAVIIGAAAAKDKKDRQNRTGRVRVPRTPVHEAEVYDFNDEYEDVEGEDVRSKMEEPAYEPYQPPVEQPADVDYEAYETYVPRTEEAFGEDSMQFESTQGYETRRTVRQISPDGGGRKKVQRAKLLRMLGNLPSAVVAAEVLGPPKALKRN